MPPDIRVNDASTALIPHQSQLGPGGFEQNGTVEWVGLLNSSVSFSVGVLARLSAGRLDPYTILVGQTLMNSQFKLELESRKKLVSVAKQLKVYKGAAAMLWYGFQIESPLSRLAQSEEGMLLCGLCGALSECYEKEYCAEVLNEMAMLTKAPDELKPSLFQWEDLLRSCSGFLSRTTFPNLLDGFIRLSETHLETPFRAVSAAGMADAILAIASVTRGQLQSITIKGNHHAGVLAAVAEWLFDLSICITKETGELLYSKGSLSEKDAQVNIIYTISSARNSDAIERVANTYLLSEATNFFRPLKMQPTGRVPWEKALSLTFGSDFHKLLGRELSGDVADVLGYVAAATELIRTTPGADLHLRPHRPNQKSSMGLTAQVLAQSMYTFFPELEPLKSRIDEASRETNFEKIRAAYMARMARIRTICACQHCQPKKVKQTNSKVRIFCLDHLVSILLKLSVSLNNIVYPPDLLLRRSGLLLFYQRRIDAAARSGTQGSVIHGTGRDIIACVMGLYCIKYPRADNCDPLLHDALMIFGADAPGSRSDRCYSAACANGICAWSLVLSGISECGSISCKVQVTPGQIEYNYRPYGFILDQNLKAPVYLPGQRDRLAEYNHPSMLVQETIEGLYTGLSLYKSSLRQSAVTTQKQRLDFCIGPAMLQKIVENGRGLVKCDIVGCKKMLYELTDPDHDTWKEIRRIRILPSGMEVDFIVGPLTSRIAIASGFLGVGRTYIWREDECLDCCLRALDRTPRPGLLSIFSATAI